MKVALYMRVSRDDLHCENQQESLRSWFSRNSTEYESKIEIKEEMSTRKTRPAKEQLMADFRTGKYQTIVVSRIDRWARSLQELVMNVEEIINSGGRFVSVLNGMDFSKKNYNASSQLMLNIFASFAQFEREIIRERTLEGLERAKLQGKIGGRHPVDCGCGKRLESGKIHNGSIKPVRNQQNQVISWLKQTPPNNPSVFQT